MKTISRLLVLLLLLAGIFVLIAVGVPAMAAHSYGPAAAGLGVTQLVEYSARLLWDDGLLTRARDPGGPEQDFEVQQGESVSSICERLASAGIISDGSLLRDYLVYTGLDTTLQAGSYQLSPAMSVIDVARKMQDATPADVTFVVLPGWRLEEVAASLPTSGLKIAPEEFVAAAGRPPAGFDFLAGATTTEGFLYPESYVIPRTTTVDQLVERLVRDFSQHVGVDLQEGFARQGLTTYQAVILASIVQREAMHPEEAPVIASVYLNRLKIGMKLDADPTVQYALGYNPGQQTWWTNPLGVDDLKISSAFNTYENGGLPPSPIDSPGLTALQAVASPADTPYFYFSARCDNSGYHSFAQTFDEHIKNLCP